MNRQQQVVGAPPAPRLANVALVHDYLTQYGGAERVVLHMARAFPEATIHTSFFRPEDTYPEFSAADVRTQPINRISVLGRHHRWALPVLAPSFSSTTVDAEVAICSSSGWAHGIRCTGRKVVYCHTPAHWLYQQDLYLGSRGPSRSARAGLALLGPPLRRWDQKAAAGCDRYLVNSTVVRQRVQDHYRRDADVLAPPPALGPEHLRRPVEGVEPGYWLCVSRLLPYKNVDAVTGAFAQLGHERLLVVGTGPDADRLRAQAPGNVTFVGRVDDDQLAWLYANAAGVVAAAHEDFGLTPVEAASFGRPVAALAWGGYLDTVEEGQTGVFFEAPDPGRIAEAVRRVGRENWSEREILDHASKFGPARFAERLRAIAAEEAAAN